MLTCVKVFRSWPIWICLSRLGQHRGCGIFVLDCMSFYKVGLVSMWICYSNANVHTIKDDPVPLNLMERSSSEIEFFLLQDIKLFGRLVRHWWLQLRIWIADLLICGNPIKSVIRHKADSNRLQMLSYTIRFAFIAFTVSLWLACEPVQYSKTLSLIFDTQWALIWLIL